MGPDTNNQAKDSGSQDQDIHCLSMSLLPSCIYGICLNTVKCLAKTTPQDQDGEDGNGSKTSEENDCSRY